MPAGGWQPAKPRKEEKHVNTTHENGTTTAPTYGRPTVWPAGKMGHVTQGPHDPSGESHNRAHPRAAQYGAPVAGGQQEGSK